MKFVKAKKMKNRKSGKHFSIGSALLCVAIGLLTGVGRVADVAAVPLPEAFFNPGDVPVQALIGETFRFKVRFRNNQNDISGNPVGTVGFGPIIDLALNSRGADGNVNGQCDGVEFISAEMVGINGGPFPLAVSPTLTDCSTSNDNPSVPGGAGTVTLPALGWGLATIALPFGSFDPTQPEVVVEVTAKTSNLADVQPASPLKICNRGGFMYGDTATGTHGPIPEPPSQTMLNSQNVDPDWECQSVTPAVYSIKKDYLGPENETATGPNFPDFYLTFPNRPYNITVDVASGQTISGLRIDDVLPTNMVFGGHQQLWVNNTLATQEPVCPGTTPPTYTFNAGQTLSFVLCQDVVGQSGANDVFINFDFYVSDAVNCQDVVLPNNIQSTAQWMPIDLPRDGPGPLTIVNNVTPAHTLTAKCLPIQKTVKVVAGTGVSGPKPGDTLEYTLNFQISDYKTIGKIIVTDRLSDGQSYVPGSATLTVQDLTNYLYPASALFPSDGSNPQETHGSVTEYSCSPVTGGTKLVFDLAEQMATMGLPYRLSQGVWTGGRAPSPLGGAAWGQIKFRATIADLYNYAQGTGDRFVDKHDLLTNCVDISGDVLGNSLDLTAIGPATGVSAGDYSSTAISVVFGGFSKTVYAVKRLGDWVCGPGFNPCQAPVQVFPRDEVTYRLSYYPVPTSDAEGMTVQDWLPLPVFKVDDWSGIGGGSGGQSWSPGGALDMCAPGTTPPPGTACYLSSDTLDPWLGSNRVTLPALPLVTSNSLNFTWPQPFNDPTNNPASARGFDLAFTLIANPNPFVDGLFLSNEAQECELNTFHAANGAPRFCQTAIAEIKMREPYLQITKGVVAFVPNGDPTNPVYFSPAAPNPLFSAPGGTCPRFSGLITSGSQIDTDLYGADADDRVTFAIVVENTGGYPAYNVVLTDFMPLDAVDVPSCFGREGNYCITDGTGVPLTSAEYTLTNIPRGGGVQIALTNPLPPASSAPPGKNLIVITYDAKLIHTIKAGCCWNTARLTSYYSWPHSATDPTGLNFVDAGIGKLSDIAKICPGPKAIEKCIVSTSESFTMAETSPSGSPPVVNVAIGEIVRYRLHASVGEGISPSYKITDALPAGMSYLGNPKVGFVSATATGITSSTLPGISNFNTKDPTCARPDPILINALPTGAVAPGPTFILGDLTNSDSDMAKEQVIIEFNALVNNVSGNANETQLWNKFSVCTGATCNDLQPDATSPSVGVNVVEPELTVQKTAAITPVVIGNTVTYTVTITNTGTAMAFDVTVADALSSCLGWSGLNEVRSEPSGVLWGSTSSTSLGLAISSIAVGQVVTITYAASILCECGSPGLVNTVKVDWTSLPSTGTCTNATGSCTPGNSGASNGERNGAGGVNDYHAEASFTLPPCSACVVVPLPNAAVGPLVGWWPLDETSGTFVADISSNNNHGTAQPDPIAASGTLPPVPGVVNGALEFDGGYVKVPSSSSLDFTWNKSITIDAWIYQSFPSSSSTALAVGIVEKLGTQSGYALHLLQNRKLQLRMGIGSNLTNFPGPDVPTGWHFVAVTVDGPAGTVRFFIDGNFIAPQQSFAANDNNLGNNNSLWIGKNYLGSQGRGFQLDEVEVFRIRLSDAQIKSIFDAGSHGKGKADFGDAPDSSNHVGAAMTAYPGSTVVAHFPTVYDPALSGNAPLGPKHRNAKGDAWLGGYVSAECEADKDPDQDSQNNIQPSVNIPNKDGFDDGVILPINLQHCLPTSFQYRVNVVGPLTKRYVNAWFDFNRDGDWNDTLACPGSPAQEWAVQNHQIELAPGAYTLTTPPFLGYYPVPGPRTMWMRITLTDVKVDPANSDGSGPAPSFSNLEGGYQYGETEDHLLELHPPTNCDLRIEKTGSAPVTLVITNVGTAACVGPSTITDVLPPNEWPAYVTVQGIPIYGNPPYAVIPDATASWTCFMELPATATTVTCTTTSTLNPGSSSTVSFPVTAVLPSPIPDCATVSNANDGNPANNVACLNARICPAKFNDANANGIRDLSESILPGWTFTITAPASPTSVTTAPITSGYPACFDIPAPGTYTVSEVAQPGWISTTSPVQTVTVPPFYDTSTTPPLLFGNFNGNALPCKTGQGWNGSECACPAGQHLVDGQCYAPLPAETCGTERWAVKTGTDTDAGSVSTMAIPTTIPSLASLPAPGSLPDSNRIAPIELNTYVLDATLVAYEFTGESDYHLVLKDAAGQTMIAKIPHPACVGATSPFRDAIADARSTFDANFQAAKTYKSAATAVRITGVGFFDSIRGQNGVAPNGLELHPVMGIALNPTGTLSGFTPVQVTEFYAPSLNHYFITANSEEAASLRNNPSLGWNPTGESFTAFRRDSFPTPAGAVCRFYGDLSIGPNSHFYTSARDECDFLKALQARTPYGEPRWNLEEIAFGVTQPRNGVCPVGTIPVLRVYNNRAMQNDSSHRYATSQAIYQQMIGAGWKGEGTVMCASQ